MPKLAVLTTCYNDGKYLAQSMASVLNQTEDDLELCVVDNGSTDDTQQVAEAFAHHDARVRILTLDANVCHGAAMNLAMQATTAPWALVHNADDWLEPDYAEAILQVAAADPTINCIFSPLQWEECRHDVQYFPPYDPAMMIVQHQIPGHRAFTRALWDALDGEDESIAIGSDWDWAVRASFAGLRPLQLSKPYVHVRDFGPEVPRLGMSANMPALRAHLRTLTTHHKRGVALC